MAADIIHHVRNLIVAHHAAERHAPLSPDHDPEHGVGGGEIAVLGEGRIGAGASGSPPVGLCPRSRPSALTLRPTARPKLLRLGADARVAAAA
jgi:hypothetical protein